MDTDCKSCGGYLPYVENCKACGSTGRASSGNSGVVMCVEKACMYWVQTFETSAAFYLPSGDDKLIGRHLGALTHEIAEMLAVPTSKARYELDKLARAGMLVKHNNPGGSCRWWPVGLAAKLST